MTVKLGGHADLAVIVGQMHRDGDPAGNLFLIPLAPSAVTPGGWDIIGTIRFGFPLSASASLAPYAASAVETLLAPDSQWLAAWSVAVAGYGPAGQADPLLDLLPLLIHHATGLGVFDVIRVDEGRCWSYVCPEEGHRRGGPGLTADPWSDVAIEMATEIGESQ